MKKIRSAEDFRLLGQMGLGKKLSSFPFFFFPQHLNGTYLVLKEKIVFLFESNIFL